MGCSVRCAANFALVFVLIGIGAQIAGILTDYWCIGSRDDVQTGNETNSMPRQIHFGIFRQTVEYDNGTEIETDSSLNLKEEQYLLVAIAGVNCLFCLILCIKAIHILVGVTSFIVMTLMLLSAFYSYEHTDANMKKLQDLHSSWPTLYLSWSFFLVFFGLIVNIIGTATFLSLLLYKGERKASHSSKGLGPSEVKELLQDTDTSDSHAYENTAYTTESSGKLDLPSTSSSGEPLNGGHPVSYSVQINDKITDESEGPENEKDNAYVNNSDDVKPADIFVLDQDDADLEKRYEMDDETIVESSRL